MNFQDIEMTESLGLRVSSYSRTSQQHPPDPKNTGVKYKCYECGGDSIKSHKCRCCHGLKEVSDNNVMVGLLMQVMCRKLGKDAPPLRNFPKLQFSSQNRMSSKNVKNKLDRQIGSKKAYDYDRSRRMDPYSEGNSANQSNSLDSSLDSLDSSQNSRSTIQSKEKLHKNKGTRYIKLYQNQPNFQHQFSEIKQQSYATEDYSVCCDKCHKESDFSGNFMQCKICKHFFICMKCYEQRVEQVRKGYHPQGFAQLPEMKKEKSAIVQSMCGDGQIDKLQIKNKSCLLFEGTKNEKVNFDNFYQIHEHPLTRYCQPSDSDDMKCSNHFEDYISQPSERYEEEGEQFTTYGEVVNSKKQREQTRGSPSYRNLFKAYDSHNQAPHSPKKSQPYLDIEVIRQQKQSPSPSQKSDAWPIRESQSQFDNNISMTISNNFESPDSEKVNANKNGKNRGSPINTNSDEGSPININLNNSSNYFISSKLAPSQAEDRIINLFGNERRSSLNKLENRNDLINHIKINRDTSQWSQYSGLYHNQSVNTSNILNNIELNQSNIEIMGNQNPSESRVIQSPDQDHQDSRSVQSGKESPIDHQFEESERQKEKNYTQRKPSKFTSIRGNVEDYQRHVHKNQEHLQRSPEVTLPQNLLTNFLGQSNGGQQYQQQMNNDSVELIPFLNFGYKKESESLFKQDFKECSKCKKEILNRSMYMKCETCERTNNRAYGLCVGCHAVRDVIEQHHDLIGNGTKHLFKACLYRKSGGMGLDMMDEEDPSNQTTLKPQFTGKHNLFSSAISLSIQPIKSTDKNVAEALVKNTQKQNSPNNQQESQEYRFTEPEEDESTYRERQRIYNEQYLKRREKKCQQNEKITKIYENLILNTLFLSNRESMGRERLSASSNAISDQYRYSENVGIDGKWLMEPLELERHTSVTCIGERESANNKVRQSATPINLETNKLNIPESQTLNIPQSTVNIITTSNTLISNDKIEQNSSISTNKNQKNSISIKLPGVINISNNCSIENQTKLFPLHNESPSRQSVISYKSGSPEKSQMSSRIRVDCGDSQSQFEHQQMGRIEEEQNFHKPSNQGDFLLSKSIKLQEKNNNILGNSYAISEPQQSQQSEAEDVCQVEQNPIKKKQKKLSSSYDYRIVTHQAVEGKKESGEVRVRSTTVNERGKYNREEGNRKQNKSLPKSNSDSEKHNQKTTGKQDERMMDFMNKIDKSQKLSKSDEEENLRDKRQQVHFNYFQDQQIEQNSSSQQAGSCNMQEEMEVIQYFSFLDYQCDKCGETPFNVRYHCSLCEDFDLCSKCYHQLQGHKHKKSNFQKIDKRKQLELDEEDKKKQEEDRNNLIKAILNKFGPQKPKSNQVRNSLPGDTQSLKTNNWRLGQSQSGTTQQTNKLPTKSQFMEKSNKF